MKLPSIKRYLKHNPDAPQSVIMLQEEANYFARCLLMPEEIVRKCWISIKVTMFFSLPSKKIKTMAIIFAVPIDEMEFRLWELGLIYNTVFLI